MLRSSVKSSLDPDPSFPLFYKKGEERVWAFSYGAHGSWNVRGLHKGVVIAVDLSGCLPLIVTVQSRERTCAEKVMALYNG